MEQNITAMNASDLSSHIQKAQEIAQKIILSGGTVRKEVDAGCINGSRKSTVEGSLAACQSFLPPPVAQMKTRIFGNHIGEMVENIKILFS